MNKKNYPKNASKPFNLIGLSRFSQACAKSAEKFRRSMAALVWFLVLSICLGLVPQANAALRTWTGGGANGQWGLSANWGGTAVVNGDDLLFSGTTRLINSNDIVLLNINSLSYNASGFLNNPATNNANYTVTITNGIVDVAGNNTNNVPWILGGALSVSNQSPNTLVLGGTINMSNRNLTLSSSGGGNLFLNGIISGTAAIGVNSVNINDGLVRLAGANTFNGDVTVNSGTLQLGNAAGIPSGNGKGNLNLALNAFLDLGNTSPIINGLNGAGTIDENPTTNAGNYILTFGTSNSNGVFSGTIGNARGIVSVVKSGSGSQSLLAPESYVGATTVNGGILAVTNGGSILSTNIAIAAGGTLLIDTPYAIPSYPTFVNLNIAPTGVFDFSLANASGGYTYQGNLSAGRSSGFATDIAGNLSMYGGNLTMIVGAPGTLTLNGNLNLFGGTLNYDLNSTTTAGAGVNDLIAASGTVDLSGGITLVKIKPLAGSLSGTYTLITSGSTIVGGPGNLQLAAPRGITAIFDTTSQPTKVLVTAAGSPNPASIVWAGNGSGGPWDVEVSQSWLSNGVPDFFYDLDTVTFNDTAGTANGAISLPNAVSPTSTTISNSAVTYTFGTANVDLGLISGTGTLTKSGPGTAILNTPNNYTGNTIVNGGTLVLGLNLTGSFVNSTVVYNGVPAANLILGNGGIYAGVQANSAMIDVFTNLVINPGGSSVGERSRQSNVTTYSLQFWGLTRNIGGTLDLANVQTRSGSPNCGIFITTNNPVYVNGMLGGYATFNESDWVVPVLSNTGNSLGSFAYAAYQANATASLWGTTSNINVTATPSAIAASQTVNSLRMPVAATVTINSGQTLTLTSGGLLVPANATGSSTITGGTLSGRANADLIVLANNLANSLTIGSTIADNTGATALTKSGQGTLVLTGNNTYSGVTYVNGATIQGGGNATPGTPFAAGILQIGAGGTVGGISNSPSITDYGTVSFNRSDVIGYTGAISGTGGVKQQGNGNTILTADSAYSGVTAITAGTLQIGNGGSTGSFSNSLSVANAGALVFNRTGATAYRGQISGIGSLTVQGGLALTLNTNETYSGNTIVSSGTLALGAAGSISNSPLISIAAGAALNVTAAGGITLNNQVIAGGGTVNGSVTSLAGTRLSPGGDGVIGTLTLANDLVLNGGVVSVDVNGASRDLLTVQGNLNLAAGTVALNNLGASIPNGTYKLIGYTGTLSGNVNNISVSGFSQAGQLASLSSATAGEIDLVVVTGFGASLTWLGDSGANLWNLALAANFTNSSGVATPFHNNDNVNFTDAGASLGNSAVNLAGSLSPASVTVNSTIDYIFQGSGGISGGSSLIHSGTDNLTILTTNSVTGPTTISSGTITLGNGVSDGALGNGSIADNAALVLNEVGSETLGGAITGNGSITLQGAGNVILTGNNSAFSGPVTISAGTATIGAGGSSGTLGTGAVANNAAIVINRSGSLTVAASINGTGVLTNSGPGLVTLTGNNTYSGVTAIANGTIKAGSTGALPSGAGVANVVLNAGTTAGILDLNGFDVNINGLDGLNGTTVGQVVNNSGTTNRLILGNGDANGTFSGIIKDGGSKLAIVKVGAGTQTIDVPSATADSYSGGLIISNGTINVTSPGGNSPVNLSASQAALGSGSITFYGGSLSLAGSIPQSSGPTWNLWAGTLVVPAGQTGTVHGLQRGQANPTLLGGGTLLYQTAYVRGQLGGDCTAFTGQILLAGDSNGGNLGLNSATTPGFPNAHVFMTNGVFLYNQVAGTPTIPMGELSGDSAVVSSLTGTEAGNNNAALAANFAIGGLNTSTHFPGNIVDNIGIIKVGSGLLSLDGSTITYTGLTTVSNGVLAFTVALPATSSAFNIAAPGVLDVSALSPLTIGNSVQSLNGNGTVDGSLVLAGASTTVVGFTNAIGTLTITNDVNLSGVIYMELNRTNATGGTNDQLTAATIELGGSLTVTNIGPALHVGDTFKLFKATAPGGLTGSITATLPATDGNNMAYTWTDNTAGNGTITVLTAVSLVNATPAPITFTVSGNQLQLTWPTDHTGWRLQVQTNPVSIGLASNWVDVAGSTSVNTETFTLNPANGSVFYRMVYP